MDHVAVYREAWGFAQDEPVLCERCQQRAGEIHHILYRSHGGDDEFGNLIALCQPCHLWSHGRADRADTIRELKRWPLRMGRP